MTYVHLLADARLNSMPNQPVLDAVPLALVKALQRAESEIFSDTLEHIRIALAQAEAET